MLHNSGGSYTTWQILQKLKIIKPKITAIIALFYAGVLFYIFSPSLEQAAMNKSWQIYIVLGSLGAICGYIASYLSCPNKALKRTHERAKCLAQRYVFLKYVSD